MGSQGKGPRARMDESRCGQRASLQEALRVVREHTVGARVRQAREVRRGVHRPDPHGEARRRARRRSPPDAARLLRRCTDRAPTRSASASGLAIDRPAHRTASSARRATARAGARRLVGVEGREDHPAERPGALDGLEHAALEPVVAGGLQLDVDPDAESRPGRRRASGPDVPANAGANQRPASSAAISASVRRRTAPRPLVVRSQRPVVDDHRMAVARELHVELDHVARRAPPRGGRPAACSPGTCRSRRDARSPPPPWRRA